MTYNKLKLETLNTNTSLLIVEQHSNKAIRF